MTASGTSLPFQLVCIHANSPPTLSVGTRKRRRGGDGSHGENLRLNAAESSQCLRAAFAPFINIDSSCKEVMLDLVGRVLQCKYSGCSDRAILNFFSNHCGPGRKGNDSAVGAVESKDSKVTSMEADPKLVQEEYERLLTGREKALPVLIRQEHKDRGLWIASAYDITAKHSRKKTARFLVRLAYAKKQREGSTFTT